MSNGEIKTGRPVSLGLPSQEEERRRNEDILLIPRVLEANVMTMLRRYTYTKTDEGAYLTPDTTIKLGSGKNAQEFTVFAGHTEQDYLRHVIFQKDTKTGQVSEWIVFKRHGEVDITDGSGRNLDTKTDRKYVRTVLNAMNENYEHDVIAKADTFDIKQHVLDTLDERITRKEAELASLQNQRNLAECKDSFDNFKVTIRSGWESENEKPLDEIVGASTLSEALQKATDKFKQINRRSDVQSSSFSVGVTVGEGQYWNIPMDVILPLFQSLTHWDNEQYEIEQAKKKN